MEVPNEVFEAMENILDVIDCANDDDDWLGENGRWMDIIDFKYDPGK